MSVIVACIAISCISIIVTSIPLYKTEFIVDTTTTMTADLQENVLAFMNECSEINYSPENITVTSVYV